jgi:hypothetical protein
MFEAKLLKRCDEAIITHLDEREQNAKSPALSNPRIKELRS